jgi:hypothetical protein
MMEALDLHGERAARRGNPSFVWRAGQNRRRDMILHWGLAGRSHVAHILVDGCGVGMYVKALTPYADLVSGIDIEAEHLEIAAHNSPTAGLALAAAETLPYAGASIDLVLSHEVLEHVEDDRLAVGRDRACAATWRAGGDLRPQPALSLRDARPFTGAGSIVSATSRSSTTCPTRCATGWRPMCARTRPAGCAGSLSGPAGARGVSPQIFPGYDNLVRGARRWGSGCAASPMRWSNRRWAVGG